MRYVNELIWHTSATPEGRWHDMDDIRRWHTSPDPNDPSKPWSDAGYHYCVLLDGTIEKGRPIERQGAHVGSRNKDTIGAVYIGGVDANNKDLAKDTRTPEQKATMERLTARLIADYDLTMVSGHNDYDKGKACPCFDARTEYAHLLGATPVDSPVNGYVTTGPDKATLYKYPSIGTPIGEVDGSSRVPLIRDRTIKWRLVRMPDGTEGWLHPDDVI